MAFCPWPCVAIDAQLVQFEKTICLFSQVLLPKGVVVYEPLPLPSIKGESICMKITQEVYIKDIEACKRNLHGSLALKKRR